MIFIVLSVIFLSISFTRVLIIYTVMIVIRISSTPIRFFIYFTNVRG